MERLLQGMKRRMAEVLSLDQLSEKYIVLAINYIFLMLYSTLESVFVNTLLYRISGDMTTVIFYRGAIFVTTAIAMHLAAYWGQKRTPIVVIRLGAVFYFLLYLLLFVAMEHLGSLMLLAAALTGIGAAFYWVGHNLLVSHYTTKNNRDIGIAVLGIIQGILTLLVPVISGFVIKWLEKDNIGYRVMFGIGMISTVLQIYYQRRLAPIEQKKHDSELRLAIKLLRNKLSFKLMMGYELLRGFRDGTFGFILNMLLFEIITDESLVGINTFLTGILSIIGSWAYGRLVKQNLRARYTVVASTILMAACVALFFSRTAGMVIFFSMINSFWALFITNSCNNFTFDVLSQNETTRKCMAEMLAIREGSMALGRVSGLVVVMLFPRNMAGYIYAMLVLTAAQFLAAFLQKQTGKILNRKQEPFVPTTVQE